MGGSVILVLFFLLWKQASVKSVRVVELRVPAHAAEEGEALLGCQFDMEGDTIYSVKWYKDGREFYRYVPTNDRPVNHFATPGVSVDESRSSSNVVTLVNLTSESTGAYGCEVSGEAPLFATVYKEKYITVYLLPENGPQITGLQSEYKAGDRVIVNCTSSRSRPETQLKWLINDQPVPKKHLQGPWYRTSVERSDATETILQLRFTVKPYHYSEGIMKLKCQATIAPLYHQEAIHNAIWPKLPIFTPSSVQVNEEDPETKRLLVNAFQELSHTTHLELPVATTHPADEEVTTDHATAATVPISTFVLLVLMFYVIIM